MVELGVYGVARLYWVVFSGVLPGPDIRRTFIVLGAFSAVVGAVMCFQQRHLKRLLAYSTVAHVGIFVMAFAALDPTGTAGAALYVAGHAGIKSALFLMVGILLNRYGTVDEGELHGRGRHARVMRWLFVAGGLALAGLPPFGTALGKAVSEDALARAGYIWVPALFVLASAITGGAVVRAGARVYFGLGDKLSALPRREPTSETEEEKEVERPFGRTPVTMVIAVIVLLAGGLAVGILPGIGSGFSHAAARFVSRTGYVSAALAGAAYPRLPPGGVAGWTGLGVGLGVLSAVLAMSFAAVALYAGHLPAAMRALVRPVAPVLLGLRRLHSGHVGDYVAWLVIGVVALAALTGLPLR
jgi:multicomponent Na+:H+ antiporter subunit D